MLLSLRSNTAAMSSGAERGPREGERAQGRTGLAEEKKNKGREEESGRYRIKSALLLLLSSRINQRAPSGAHASLPPVHTLRRAHTHTLKTLATDAGLLKPTLPLILEGNHFSHLLCFIFPFHRTHYQFPPTPTLSVLLSTSGKNHIQFENLSTPSSSPRVSKGCLSTAVSFKTTMFCIGE